MEAPQLNRITAAVRSLFILQLLLSANAQLPFPGGGVGAGPGFPISGTIPTIPAGVSQQIVDTLRTGGFSLAGWAIKALSNFIPVYTTLMIPTNAAIAAFANLNQTQVPSLLLYHVATGVLPFNVLSQFPVGQRIPTMLIGNPIVVTDNSAGNYSLNGARVVRPNLCGNTTVSVITCHGIDRVLLPTNLAAAGPGGAPVGAPGPQPGGRRGPMTAPAPGRNVPPPTPTIVIPGPAIAPGAPPAVDSIAPSQENATSPSGAPGVVMPGLGPVVVLAVVCVSWLVR